MKNKANLRVKILMLHQPKSTMKIRNKMIANQKQINIMEHKKQLSLRISCILRSWKNWWKTWIPIISIEDGINTLNRIITYLKTKMDLIFLREDLSKVERKCSLTFNLTTHLQNNMSSSLKLWEGNLTKESRCSWNCSSQQTS